jgi:hypothetical protein
METDWGRAYAKQAQADFNLWKVLDSLPDAYGIRTCHKLHLLQMACEKICKAYLCKHKSKPSDLQQSHAYVKTILPLIARSRLARNSKRLSGKYDYRLNLIKKLAGEIDLLVPTIKNTTKRLDNCEYPWESSPGKIQVPCEYAFPNLASLSDPVGKELVKLIEASVKEFAADL